MAGMPKSTLQLLNKIVKTNNNNIKNSNTLGVDTQAITIVPSSLDIHNPLYQNQDDSFDQQKSTKGSAAGCT